ncbi:hypothetical protein [Pseudomonas sp. NPDC089401]|uniref:hypothetical protein n=1 Tax=Pseudomonas sp. NPDC089401 TaxID=3364462 RepID=UPI003808EF11
MNFSTALAMPLPPVLSTEQQAKADAAHAATMALAEALMRSPLIQGNDTIH